MDFSEKLKDRVREVFSQLPSVEEKRMFGGTCFMLQGKMCVAVKKDEMMCRIDPGIYNEALSQPGCREIGGKRMKSFVYVDEEGLKTQKQFDYWINLCIEFNKKAKATVNKNKPKNK